jgi:Ca2+-binding EF-hand superfamily protein
LLNKKEFMAGLDAMSINLSLKDREQLFKYLDVSHDGSLSFREFGTIFGETHMINSHSAE